MTVFYNLAIGLYLIGVRLAAFSNAKAAMWIDGRNGLLKRIEKEVNKEDKIIWIHCASLGEFEQGRPIIERIKKADPDAKIFLTFFSPSGYEVRKEYELASYVYYLPIDSKHNAERFLDIIRPTVAIFVKYEYWLHYLTALQRADVPTYLVSARFRKDQVFFKWYGGLFKSAIAGLTKIFVQDDNSLKLAESLGLENAVLGGDTRYDRVVETVKNVESVQGLEEFSRGARVLIGGSTWPIDEDFLLPFINAAPDHLKLILAPHEVNQAHIKEIEEGLKVAYVKYSEIESGDLTKAKVLLIDNVGMLSNLYQYGEFAYVGGGFTGALHNILEPAAFGMPIIFGPRHDRFPEAAALISAGGAFSVADGLEFVKKMAFLADPFVVKIAAEITKRFVAEHTGASDQVVSTIKQGLFDSSHD